MYYVAELAWVRGEFTPFRRSLGKISTIEHLLNESRMRSARRAGFDPPTAAVPLNRRRNTPRSSKRSYAVSLGRSYSHGFSPAALRPEMRPKARHSPMLPVPW
jgi:hypothetical protein